MIGLSRNTSMKSVTLKDAFLDALAMHELFHNGFIRANVIAYNARLADSLGISLGSQIEFPNDVKLLEHIEIGDLFIGLFDFIYNGESKIPVVEYIDQQRITAIGKQTIHPDRIYESWASAEIEAFKELSRIKKSKIKSITKKDGQQLEKLIFLQSDSYLANAQIDQRWVDNNVAYVQASDAY